MVIIPSEYSPTQPEEKKLELKWYISKANKKQDYQSKRWRFDIKAEENIAKMSHVEKET